MFLDIVKALSAARDLGGCRFLIIGDGELRRPSWRITRGLGLRAL